MYLTAEKKSEIYSKHGKSDIDTGSAEGQVAMFTFRISRLTDHLKENKHDFVTQRSLVMMVGKRRRLLDYIKNKDITKYRELIKELNLRK